MKDQSKSKQLLIQELVSLREQIAELDQSELVRKQAEESLRESEEKYRSIIENMQEGYFENDLAGNFTFVNDAVCRLMGYPREELIGKNNRAYADEESAKKIYQIYNKIYRTGEPIKGIEEEHIRKDGTRGFAEFSVSLIRDTEGKPIGFRGISHDITERKRAEEALKKSEEMLRLITQNMSDMIRVTDLQGVNLYTSPSHFKGLGYTAEERVGKSAFDIVHPDDLERCINLYTSSLTADQPITVEYRVRHADGHYVWLETVADLLKDAQGKTMAIVASSRDISGRKQAEESLRESEEKYRSIIENMQEGYFENDLAGNFTFVNDAVCRLMGYPREELIGKNNRAYADEESAKKIYQIYNKIYRTGEPIKGIEEEHIRKDGTKGFAELSVSLIRDTESKPIGFRGISHDITERKQAEETLRQSEEKYRLVVENAKESIIITQDVKLVFVNRAAVDMTGYSEEILISKPFTDFLHPDDRNMVVDHHLRRIKGEEVPLVYSFRVVSQDGTVKWVELNAALIHWKGRPATLNFLNDITERKLSEVALRESEDKYKSLIDNVPGIILTIDLEGKITFVNQRTKEILGHESAEMINMNIFNFVPEEDHQMTIETLQKGMRGEKITDFQIPIITKSGERLFFTCSFSRIYKDGAIVGAQGTAIDISERKRAEEERKQSFARLRKVLGATVHSISRTVEMRDPYTSGHQRRVSDVARAIATEMGLSADRQDFIRTAANIHDIGKIAIPAEILSKPTKLIDLELGLIKTHSQSGYDILKDIEFPWPVADVVLQHHERMDGSGYPQGLKGDDILLEARILAVADVVEAIASHRPYRPALGIDFALEEISRNRGVIYDAEAVDACLKLFREKGYQLR